LAAHIELANCFRAPCLSPRHSFLVLGDRGTILCLLAAANTRTFANIALAILPGHHGSGLYCPESSVGAITWSRVPRVIVPAYALPNRYAVVRCLRSSDHKVASRIPPAKALDLAAFLYRLCSPWCSDFLCWQHFSILRTHDQVWLHGIGLDLRQPRFRSNIPIGWSSHMEAIPSPADSAAFRKIQLRYVCNSCASSSDPFPDFLFIWGRIFFGSWDHRVRNRDYRSVGATFLVCSRGAILGS
jgi:hypothetical protein